MSKEFSGTPTMALLPARNHKFTVSDDKHTITIPSHGKYKDLDSVFFEEKDGEFDVFFELEDAAAETSVVNLAAITKILLGVAKYPDLQDNQYFTPHYLIIKEDEVDIVGYIIDVVKEETSNVE